MATPEPNPPNALRFSLFEHVLRKYHLIDPQALDDPEGFDNYRTHGAVNAAYRELTAALTPPAVEKAATEGGTPIMDYADAEYQMGDCTIDDVFGTARDLERRLAEAKALLTKISPLSVEERHELERLKTVIEADISTIDGLRSQLATLERELAEAKAELIFSANCNKVVEKQLATALRDKEAGEADTARLHAVTENKWSLSFNDRIGLWTVQAYQQVAGCIAAFNTPRKAIDAAMSAKGDAT